MAAARTETHGVPCSSRPCRCPKRASLQRFVRKRAQGKEGREGRKGGGGSRSSRKGEAPTRDPWCALCSSRPCRCAAPRYSGNYVPHASPGGDIAPSRDRRETYRSGRTAIDVSYPAPRHVRRLPTATSPVTTSYVGEAPTPAGRRTVGVSRSSTTPCLHLGTRTVRDGTMLTAHRRARESGTAARPATERFPTGTGSTTRAVTATPAASTKRPQDQPKRPRRAILIAINALADGARIERLG